MWWLAFFAVLLAPLPPAAVSVGHYARTVSYDDDIIVQCPDRSKATVKLLERHSDVWRRGKESVELRIHRAAYQSVRSYFPECSITVENLEAHVKASEHKMFPARKVEEDAWAEAVVEEICIPGLNLAACERAMEAEESRMQFERTSSWFEEYHDYKAICTWYRRLATSYPILVRYVPSIGKSVEGRDLPAVHITAAEGDPHRHKIYFQCLIHAREWISGSVCMYITNYLVRNYGKDAKVTSLLDSLEFVIVPVVNPDGYVYTWSRDRLWRKNRAVIMDSDPRMNCYGVDINRNFPQGWKEAIDVAGIGCRTDYGGPLSKSEPETQAIMSYFRKNAPIVGAIDWHSYGELILRPWGWSSSSIPDEDRLRELANEMTSMIQDIHHQSYTAKTSYQLYQCFGIATDWFYSTNAAQTNHGYRPASFVVELRDKGGSGFLLPADQIIPTGEEIIPAMIHFAESLKNNPIHFTTSDQHA